jgi:hypothetical protein
MIAGQPTKQATSTVRQLDNGDWKVVVVLPDLGKYMHCVFESRDDALDWMLDLRAMYAQAMLDQKDESV